jgi:hypothetical protein
MGADPAKRAIDQCDLTMKVYLRFVVCKDLRASHRWPNIAPMLNLPDKGGFSVGPKPVADLRP